MDKNQIDISIVSPSSSYITNWKQLHDFLVSHEISSIAIWYCDLKEENTIELMVNQTVKSMISLDGQYFNKIPNHEEKWQLFFKIFIHEMFRQMLSSHENVQLEHSDSSIIDIF